MNVGGGFICTGPFTNLIRERMGTGPGVKFYSDGENEEYTFVRRIENEDKDEDAEESNAINKLCDTLTEIGVSVDIDFSTTIMPTGLPAALSKNY